MSIVMTDTCTNVSRRVAPSPPIEGNTELRKGGQWPTQKLRAVLSDFGARISFGFRISAPRGLGYWLFDVPVPSPHSPAQMPLPAPRSYHS